MHQKWKDTIGFEHKTTSNGKITRDQLPMKILIEFKG